jgi:hypothetical protein
MYCAVKGDLEKPMVFSDKVLVVWFSESLSFYILIFFLGQAIQLAPKHSASFLWKAQFLFSQNNFEQALISYSQANSLEQDIASFSGMKLFQLKCAVDILFFSC